MKKTISFILLLFLSFACDQGTDPGINDNPPILRELSDNEISIVSSSNRFAFELLRTIDDMETGGNYFYSPLSVEYALAMTLNGSSGDTWEAIRETLSQETLDEAAINKSYQSITEFLLGIDKTVILKIANSIWYKEILTVNPDFRESAGAYYDAEVAGLDFGAPAAKDRINGWVSEKTEGLIGDLIDQIPPDAVMYLINAIYFKAQWQFLFDKSMTHVGPFYLDDGSRSEIELMTCKGAEVGYFSNELLRLVDIPYGNGQFSMTIIVPAGDHSLAEVIAAVSQSSFMQWTGSALTGKSELTMPKFKIEYKTLLNDHLSELGMGIAFTDAADLSRLFEDPMGLKISRVIHQAVIEVNEEGSEAAAATAVEIVETALPPEPETIMINRPFLFLIREKFSGTVLFAGKLSDPGSLE